ncbi:Exosome complex component csl4 [Zancudomyces culisetae]|uniref:Exosome complex component csl4 n=1 Tax=Zancudomyces culisetae TaxID=1213189 RepID=A0A1R1PCT4_ZANCU|nr:Exosome complex component csl4 [Zancudomyces culisetae]|eukprot:OMH78787.1 Exosome complex component csl4 [Zancudomyces culisetae]
MDARVVTPGRRLGLTSEYIPGQGVYVRNDTIISSSRGTLEITNPIHNSSSGTGPDETLNKIIDVPQGEDSKTQKPIISVVKSKFPSTIPTVGSIILGKVTKINIKQAFVVILSVGDLLCHEEFNGIISISNLEILPNRVQDVRATEKDKVQIFNSFRPGDVIRAKVISLGDQKSYYLSTASNELGVIFAQATLTGT